MPLSLSFDEDLDEHTGASTRNRCAIAFLYDGPIRPRRDHVVDEFQQRRCAGVGTRKRRDRRRIARPDRSLKGHDQRLDAIGAPVECLTPWMYETIPYDAVWCEEIRIKFLIQDIDEAGLVMTAMQVLPIAVGLLLGVGLVGREIEGERIGLLRHPANMERGAAGDNGPRPC